MLVYQAMYQSLEQDEPMDQVTVDLLACRARDGCHDSFNRLALHFITPLTRAVAVRHRGNLADAEDVVQEAMMKAFRCIAMYDGRYSFRTWLFTIAFRVSTDQLRRRQAKPFLSLDITSNEIAGVVDSVDGDSTNIWKIASDTLTEPQYTALWLAYAEDLKPTEVARIIGKSAVATRVLLYRARRTLHRQLMKNSPSSFSVNNEGESI